MTTNKEIKPPKVTVSIPKVTLRLEDLTYLRSMDNQDKIKCHVPEAKKHRLRILRLIETRQLPPSKEYILKIIEEKGELLKRLQTALGSEDWQTVHNVSWSLKMLKDRLSPTPTDVLTEQGHKLLETGTITVTIRKTGCL